MALKAFHKMSIIWNYDVLDKIKLDYIQDITVYIIQYGWTTTLIKCLETKLDVNFTRRKHTALIISGSNIHKTSTVWPLSSHLKNHSRWRKHAGNCWRSMNEFINRVLLCILAHGWVNVGRNIDLHQLCTDTRCSLEDPVKINGW